MKSAVLLSLLLIGTIGLVLAQDKHNFKMEPTKTDCHNIVDLDEVTLDSALQILSKAEFRLKEELQISRYRSPRQLDYLSCEGDNGYLIAKEDEDKTVIFQNVPKKLWDSLSNSKDPINLYQSGILKKYLVLKD